MSFTQDELQAFNAILDQRLTAQRREMEHALDQRIDALKREFDQRLVSLQQNLLRTLPQRLSELQGRLRDDVNQKLDTQQTYIAQALNHEIESALLSQSQQFENQIESALAAQLLAIEQLISQRSSMSVPEIAATYSTESQPDFESIEVQTEIPWEDLVDVVDKAMGQRFTALDESLQAAMKTMEQFLAGQLQSLRDELVQAQEHSLSGNIAHIQDIFTSIEQLEHIVESMQVAMNANHTLLSNRLYHHQRLPLERAHHSVERSPASLAPGKRPGNVTTPLPFVDEQGSEDQQE
jgi:hypothetical protein